MPLEAALTQKLNEGHQHVAMQLLSEEELSVLKHACTLIQIADPHFTLALVDVVETPKIEVCLNPFNPIIIYLEVNTFLLHDLC